MKISALHIHPIKSGRAVSVERVRCVETGLSGDRDWMIVDDRGRFLTQREWPRLALLEATPDADGLHLGFPGDAGLGEGGERFVALPDGEKRLTVRVWADEVDAALASEADNAALSHWLGRAVRLVHFDAQARRSIPAGWLDREAPVNFADGFPILIATEESLRALNRSIVAADGEAVPMSRFRPNVVLTGAEPFAEDGWATLRIGELLFDLVKPCARCVTTTVDQSTGRRDGAEPIATLTRLRRSADDRAPGVLFGWNAVPRGTGELAVGDEAEISAERPGGWPLRPEKTRAA